MGKEQKVKGFSKRDKALAARFSALSGVFAESLPMPRIEGVAQKTKDRLVDLRSNLDVDYLMMGPNGDILTDAYDNLLFLTKDILPIVSNLMQRTKSGIPLGNTQLGCRYIAKKDGGKDSVEVEIFDASDNFDNDDDFELSTPKVNNLVDLQKYWDEGDEDLRKSIKKFSKMTKNKLLRYFEKFVDEYCD